MTNKLRLGIYLAVFALTVLAFTSYLALTASQAQANPTAFGATASSAVATTTPVYMTVGTATTTTVYDAYGIAGTNEASSGSTQAADSIALLQEFAGSSTASTLNTDIQYSQDGKTWYALAIGSNAVAVIASSTVNIGIVQTFSFPYASSTIDRLITPVNGAGNATTSTRIIILPTPTRFIRAVSYLPNGSLNGALWQQFVPKKQR